MVAWVKGHVARIPLGLRYMILAAFFFSILTVLVKIVGQRLPPEEIVLGRSVVSLAITYLMLRRARITPWGSRKGLLVGRGLVGFAALMCFFYAIPRLPLADVTLLQYTHPVYTSVLAALFLGEALRRKVVVSIFLSLVGVVLIAQPSFLFGQTEGSLALLPVGAALLGATFTASAYVLVRKLRDTEHPLVVVFYFPLVSIPASLPLLATSAVWPTPLEWLMLLGIGIFTQLGQVYLTHGLHREEAGRASSVSYIQILFAAAWGMLLFSEFPDLLSIVGAGFIVAGLALSARNRSKPGTSNLEAETAPKAR